jgi:2-(1,2-epoxy-1,2-dihydrophenyl)acetyl-CoA isomerase
VFVKRAISAGMVLLPAHVGLKHATRLLFEGDIITPAAALELGLISKIADPGNLDTAVCEMAERLAAGPTRVYGHIKEGLNRAYFPTMDEDLRLMAFMQNYSTRTADATEARAAWRERRTPAITGR